MVEEIQLGKLQREILRVNAGSLWAFLESNEDSLVLQWTSTGFFFF